MHRGFPAAYQLAKLIQQACEQALPLLAQLPPDEADTEIKPKIEAMTPAKAT
jgi:hypothetical protein